MKIVVCMLGVLAAQTLATPLAAQDSPPVINVRIDGEPWFAPGEAARARYFAEAGSYVAVLQVGIDGEVRVLIPEWPRQSMRAASSDENRVPFRAERKYGSGAIVAVASRTPLNLVPVRGRDGDWRRVVVPLDDEGEVGVRHLARMMAGPLASYDVVYAEYHVGRRGWSDDGVRDMSYGAYDGYGVYVPYGRYDGFGLGWDGVYRGDDWRRHRHHDGWGSGRGTDGRGRVFKRCADGSLVPATASCPVPSNRHVIVRKPTPVPHVSPEGRRPQRRLPTPERRPR